MKYYATHKNDANSLEGHKPKVGIQVIGLLTGHLLQSKFSSYNTCTVLNNKKENQKATTGESNLQGSIGFKFYNSTKKVEKF